MAKLNILNKIKSSIFSFGQPLGYSFIEILSVLIFFSLKYGTNGMGLTDFVPFYFGNLLLICPAFLLIIAQFYFNLLDKKAFTKRKKSTIFRFVWMLLSFLGILTTNLFSGSGVYLTNISKMIYVVSFSVLLISVWISVFGTINRIMKFRKATVIIYEAALLLLCLILFAFFKVNRKTEIYTGGNIDIAVILGAAVYSNNEPSPIFAKRIERAAELFKDEKIAYIQAIGGSAPGEISEARAAFNKLDRLGIPKSRIRIEETTAATAEQIRFVKTELSAKYGRVAMISDEFHLPRIEQMSAFFNIEPVFIASGNNIGLKNYFYYKFRETAALLIFWIFAL